MRALTIADVDIRRDVAGRYCLNDLHRAAGGEKRHGPSYWITNAQTRAMIKEIGTTGIPAVQSVEGAAGGTYVAKELVYAYAMWISPAFHLRVIRAYDAMQAPRPAPVELSRMQLIEIAMQAESERLQLEQANKQLQAAVEIAAPKAEALDRLAEADGMMNLTNAAKALQTPPQKLIAWMSGRKWIYRRPGGGHWVAYQDRIQFGYLTHKVTTIHREDGSEKVVEAVRVTARGLARLSVLLGKAKAEATA